jgi:hypothetical protein
MRICLSRPAFAMSSALYLSTTGFSLPSSCVPR